MVKKLIKIFSWVTGAILLWLVYLTISILNFPAGTLSDRAETAIVLGAAVNIDKPSPVFAERINHAINLYQAGKVKKLIFTGGVGEKQKYAESIIARNYAISREVKAQDILLNPNPEPPCKT